jgi:hypothetical protein
MDYWPAGDEPKIEVVPSILFACLNRRRVRFGQRGN